MRLKKQNKTIVNRDFCELRTKVSYNCFLPGKILSHIKTLIGILHGQQRKKFKKNNNI